MKVKIDKDGFLWIKRGNVFKPVCCPFSLENEQHTQCGDWCALFDVRKEAYRNPVTGETITGFVICLCRRIYECKELIDEREK